MNSKINSLVIPAILAFALIGGILPAVFAQNNTGMTSEDGNMTGMTQSQTTDDGDDGGKDDGDSEDDKDKGE